MSSPHDKPLSGLQLAVLRVLWEQGEARVAAVHAGLRARREIAATTVATLLSRLEKRGLVTHRTEGRQFVYRALQSEAEVSRSMVSALTDNLFQGDPAQLLAHLVRERDIDPGDLSRIKKMIEEKERG